MLDGRVLGASQVEYKPFGKPPLKRETTQCPSGSRKLVSSESCRVGAAATQRSGEPGPGAGGLKALRVGLLRIGNDPNSAKQPAEHEGVAGAAPHWGRRKDTQGRLCGRGGSGAGRSEAGQRHAAEEPGAAAGHPAKPRSDLHQLPGPHPPQPRPPGPGVLPPHAAPPVRGRLTHHELRAAGGGLERAARRLQ